MIRSQQVETVKCAVSDRDRPVVPPSNYENMANRPMQAKAGIGAGYEPKEACPRCKNCGAPI